MTPHNLDALFRPASIALIGASNQRGSIGAILATNLLRGPLKTHVWPLSPQRRRIRGARVYPDLDQLPQTPDLGVVCAPATEVAALVADLGHRGTRAAVIIGASLAKARDDPEGALQRAMVEAARAHGLRLLGPNCLGILIPGIGLNASLAHRPARPGKLAFVAQSGAILTSALDWAEGRGIGFSALISLGDMADLDFADLLDHLAVDPGTNAILLCMESVGNARRFLSAARAAARVKPVVALKLGCRGQGERATLHDSGALVSGAAVCQAAFDRAGILRVFTLAELFDAAEVLAQTRPPKGDRLAILTNGVGIGILATDALLDAGGRLAELSEETRSTLDRVLPPSRSHSNPLNLAGDATGGLYRKAVNILQKDPGVDGILALHAPRALVSAVETAEAVASTAEKGPLLLTSWVGGKTMAEPRRRLTKRGVLSYETPEQAVRAFLTLEYYRRGQQRLTETAPSVPEGPAPDMATVATLIARALGEGHRCLTGPEATACLTAYRIPAVETRAARDPVEAAEIAGAMDGPLVLKILSPDVGHESGLGGVVLDLRGPDAVHEAARAMTERIARSHPAAQVQGFVVQPMVRRPGARELIVGAVEDPQFGPVILVGQGGIGLDAVEGVALGLPPLNLRQARGLLEGARIHRLPPVARGRPAADLDAVALTLVRVSQLVVDHPEIRELEINPLLADDQGVSALDARMTLARAERPGSSRLAVRPYPKELEETIRLPGGRALRLRPIRPEDEPALRQAFSKLTLEEIRLRFFVPMPALSHEAAARLTQIDYDREMALILAEPDPEGRDEIYGVARLIADPGKVQAEFAIVVRQAMAGRGFGTLLMRRILDYARDQGIRRVFGVVLPDNGPMLRLSDRLGFERRTNPQDPGTILVTLDLEAKGGSRAGGG